MNVSCFGLVMSKHRLFKMNTVTQQGTRMKTIIFNDGILPILIVHKDDGYYVTDYMLTPKIQHTLEQALAPLKNSYEQGVFDKATWWKVRKQFKTASKNIEKHNNKLLWNYVKKYWV